jgi:hypothetical protein
MRYISSAVVAVVLSASAHGFGTAQPAQEVQQVFAQLQDASTSGEAYLHLKALAPKSADARQYLAIKLPGLIATTSQEPVLRNSIRFAGDLRIAEAVPILVKLLNQYPGGGPVTIAEAMRLDTDPVGKALAEIGEPAIGAVRNVLENNSNSQSMRMRAGLVLSNMNSKDADNVLALHLQSESDPRVKELIQSQLREHEKKSVH